MTLTAPSFFLPLTTTCCCDLVAMNSIQIAKEGHERTFGRWGSILVLVQADADVDVVCADRAKKAPDLLATNLMVKGGKKKN